MKQSTLKRVILICTAFLLLITCEDITDEIIVSPEDSTAAVILAQEAHAALIIQIQTLLSADPDSAQAILDDLDFSEINELYAEAHEKDYRNNDARFGMGFSSMLLLSQQFDVGHYFGNSIQVQAVESSRSIQQMANPIGYGFGLPLSSERVAGMVGAYIEFPLASLRLNFAYLDTFNELQSEVINQYIPMVEAGIESLDSLNTVSGLVFDLGNGFEVDSIDINAIEFSLLALQGLLKQIAAYDFALNTQDTTELVAGLSSGSSYASLYDNGQTLLNEAHASGLLAIEKAREVLNSLVAESSVHDHLLVQFDADEASAIEATLDSQENALSEAGTFEYGVGDERGDIGALTNINIDISQYYLNSVQDLKGLLPEYTVTTTTEYNYNQVIVAEAVNYEEEEVTMPDLDNTPISVNFQYSELNSDTTATVTIGLFLQYNLLRINREDLPPAIWDLYDEFLLAIADYSGELYNYPEISFQWSGVITTGSSLVISGNVAIDYLERTSSFIAPVLSWTATSHEEWLSGWSDPTVQGLFPDFTAENIADLMGIGWE